MGLDYLNVFERSAARTTTVLYDRAGTGWSDRAALPRPAPEVVDELHALLHTLGVAPPYVLVGHSLGGAFARHYAQRFPHEVAALLLLDPAHEELAAHYPPEVRKLFAQAEGQPIPDLPHEVLAMWRSVFADKLQRWPAPARDALIEKHASAWRIGFLEGQQLEEGIYEPLRRGGALPDVPCTVLTAMGIDTSPAQSLPETVQRAVNEAKQSVNRLLAASVPQGEECALHEATHPWMHIESEDAVIEALDGLLQRVVS
jgi:pimeloyl-ACP methyl ester carboxylesterase